MKKQHDYSKNLKKLLELDLTEREAKIYMALLSKKAFTISELQQTANVPRNKIYEVLNKMIDRGICIEHDIGNIRYYEAVEPKTAFSRMLERYENNFRKDVENKKEIIKNLVEIFTPVFEENKEIVDPLDFIEVLKDKNQIQKKYVQALNDTNYEILTFNKGPYVCDNTDRLNEQKEAETNLLLKGGICRNIYEFEEIKNNEWLLNYIQDQKKLGQQAKVIKSLPIKMMLFDEKIVMFPLQQRLGIANKITMIYIEHKELALACKLLFNILWEQATSIELAIEELMKVRKN